MGGHRNRAAPRRRSVSPRRSRSPLRQREHGHRDRGGTHRTSGGDRDRDRDRQADRRAWGQDRERCRSTERSRARERPADRARDGLQERTQSSSEREGRRPARQPLPPQSVAMRDSKRAAATSHGSRKRSPSRPNPDLRKGGRRSPSLGRQHDRAVSPRRRSPAHLRIQEHADSGWHHRHHSHHHHHHHHHGSASDDVADRNGPPVRRGSATTHDLNIAEEASRLRSRLQHSVKAPRDQITLMDDTIPPPTEPAADRRRREQNGGSAPRGTSPLQSSRANRPPEPSAAAAARRSPRSPSGPRGESRPAYGEERDGERRRRTSSPARNGWGRRGSGGFSEDEHQGLLKLDGEDGLRESDDSHPLTNEPSVQSKELRDAKDLPEADGDKADDNGQTSFPTGDTTGNNMDNDSSGDAVASAYYANGMVPGANMLGMTGMSDPGFLQQQYAGVAGGMMGMMNPLAAAAAYGGGMNLSMMNPLAAAAAMGMSVVPNMGMVGGIMGLGGGEAEYYEQYMQSLYRQAAETGMVMDPNQAMMMMAGVNASQNFGANAYGMGSMYNATGRYQPRGVGPSRAFNNRWTRNTAGSTDDGSQRGRGTSSTRSEDVKTVLATEAESEKDSRAAAKGSDSGSSATGGKRPVSASGLSDHQPGRKHLRPSLDPNIPLIRFAGPPQPITDSSASSAAVTAPNVGGSMPAGAAAPRASHGMGLPHNHGFI